MNKNEKFQMIRNMWVHLVDRNPAVIFFQESASFTLELRVCFFLSWDEPEMFCSLLLLLCVMIMMWEYEVVTSLKKGKGQ